MTPSEAGPVELSKVELSKIGASSPLFAMLGDSNPGMVCDIDGVCAVPEDSSSTADEK